MLKRPKSSCFFCRDYSATLILVLLGRTHSYFRPGEHYVSEIFSEGHNGSKYELETASDPEVSEKELWGWNIIWQQSKMESDCMNCKK